jgi:DNA processing protein
MNDTGYYWYKLSEANGFGPKSIYTVYKSIIEKGCTIEDFFKLEKHEFEKRFPTLGKGRFKSANYESIKELSDQVILKKFYELQDKNIEIIFPGHKEFPDRLVNHLERGISSILFCLGKTDLLKKPSISIVGSRKASDDGLNAAHKLASKLSSAGKNIVSGYAKGIDTTAHMAALKNNGTTSMVLSYGILEFIHKNDFIGTSNMNNTLVISQFHPKETWNARNAMIRNKLVCALSEALIVIESGEEKDDFGRMSGTFEAAKNALDMKIPLFVVSSTVFSESPPVGNIELIRRGGIEIYPDEIDSILNHINNTNSRVVKEWKF